MYVYVYVRKALNPHYSAQHVNIHDWMYIRHSVTDIFPKYIDWGSCISLWCNIIRVLQILSLLPNVLIAKLYSSLV
jgi:hypothetical protein